MALAIDFLSFSTLFLSRIIFISLFFISISRYVTFMYRYVILLSFLSVGLYFRIVMRIVCRVVSQVSRVVFSLYGYICDSA